MTEHQLPATPPPPIEAGMIINIPTDDVPRPWTEVADWYQRQDVQALTPSLYLVAGLPFIQAAGETTYLRAYLERGRGHSKTTDTAFLVIWLMVFSPRRLFGVVAAADRDQARLILDSIAAIIAATPWLAEILQVQAWRVINKATGSVLDVLSSDVASSYGITPDFIVCDELTHWKDSSGEALWHSLFSSAMKRRHCLLIIISNAGVGMGVAWQWHIRELFRQNPNAYFHSLDGVQGKRFLDNPALLEELCSGLPPLVRDRLIFNLWTTGFSDALPEECLDAALSLDGPLLARDPQEKYIAGLDLGLSKHHSSLVIIGKKGTSYRLALCQDWRPPRGGRVSIDEIEQAIVAAHQRYGLTRIACDPWNAGQLVERLRKQGLPIVEQPQSGANLVKQCKTLLEAFTSHSIRLYDHPSLTTDLRTLRVEEKQYGCRLVSDAGAGGHGDRASALSIALAAAHDVIAETGAWGGVIFDADLPERRWDITNFDDFRSDTLPRNGMPSHGPVVFDN